MFRRRSDHHDSDSQLGRMAAEREESYIPLFPAFLQLHPPPAPPPAPGSQQSPRAHLQSLREEAAWATFISHLSFAAGPPLVVGHLQLNLHNRALGTDGKPVQAPQPSISILFSLPTAAPSGLAQPVLTSSAQTEQRRLWEKLVILVTPRNTPFTCDMTNISAIRISRSLIILDALTYIPNHYLI